MQWSGFHKQVEEITEIYNGFLNKTFPVIDKDYGDMSLPFDAPESDYNMINVLLPRSYKPEIKGNIFEKRSASIVRQLFEGHKKPDSEEDLEMEIDFDQILAKKPGRNSAAFAWHQDMGYWPPAPKGVSTATATVSLALNEAHVENGCLILVEKSHTEGLRKHRPLMAKDNLEDILENEKDKMDANDGVDVADGHALKTTLTDDDVVTHLPIAMGGVSIHDEWIVHGSPGNNHPTEWRHTYILAYREKEMIAQERKLGFTHSHNNKFQWDSFRKENVVDVEAPDGPKHTSAGPKHTEL